MPTDDERRAVARRLRQAWVNVPDTNRVRHHLRVLYEIYEAIGVSGDRRDAIDLFDRLADLIEPESERTCRVDSSHVEQEMGGYSYLEVELSCGHAFTWDDGTPPDYCPYCGAKVVSE